MVISQFKDGYRYNSDTIMLYDFALSLKLSGEILEVGSGSGVLGLLLKRDLKNTLITMIDIQDENIALSIQNSRENSLSCDIIQADFSKFKSDKRFDHIISNPPFYHDGVRQSQNKHLQISRYASNLSLENLISNSSSHLKSHGSLVFCYDAKQLMYIAHLLKQSKFALTKLKFVYPKKGKSAKLALIEAKKSSRSLCEVLENIYLSDENGYAKEAHEIFKKANLTSKDV
ncbi:tRNA1(Val) (adenine(37)-N6)-methyltransferase [Campylobacter geochelonis]|uniref:UDP-MurNac-pentapeptide presynthetase n=1 Tax=Campylobacter geochelonis TaxID=1780362 RepID=A0A128EJ30_9BACT|nr:methyltransferase [Campylobacter geochelonis]QKF71436.1 tRNA m6A37 methyltransferase [Campylobacter geochelonis]CZE47829.1 UDP-MurNac-pentapeptide presynthetase [Campylobacter geochelonis]CZE48348.1 UDP-MurNac-pentapeptide presynthetase [Campylobacter geochelonis]CZE50856.1 UDP-MurNac-pentapeptide presynthetase [Campylobacter geochelonis]